MEEIAFCRKILHYNRDIVSQNKQIQDLFPITVFSQFFEQCVDFLIKSAL